ncbi:MAG TPA: DUF308 domain-containing protein [Alphaproteobacteria bacterium]|jgi:uncharacterized membrane protein HdeD (DUF308 family)|nr:DUF308 domain-containing protein [Alphaproteobacteria bacterium]
MVDSSSPQLEQIQHKFAEAIQAHWKLFLIQGIAMILLGLIAVALPNIATLAIAIFIGWLFLIGGVVRALSVWRARAAPGFGWSLATALVAIVLGLILVLRPLEGVLTLTMVLIALFLVEGVAAIVIALEFRRHIRQWGWTLFNGIVDLILAYLIFAGWPSTAAWAIGLLVGINMLFLGLSLTMTALAGRAMRAS